MAALEVGLPQLLSSVPTLKLSEVPLGTTFQLISVTPVSLDLVPVSQGQTEV